MDIEVFILSLVLYFDLSWKPYNPFKLNKALKTKQINKY